MNKEKSKKVWGWVAVIISALFSCFWAFWGINENFHEGWYFHSIWSNLAMMFGQYMIVMILFIAMSLITLKWQKAGGIIHIVLGIFLCWFFGGLKASVLFIMIPFIALGIAYYTSILPNKRTASILLLGVPLLIVLSFGIYHYIRVSNRVNDNNFETRIIKGNGIELLWAPAGPGWPDDGTSWEKAKNICSHLKADGKTISDTVQNIWRLPTVDEAVRSMVYHGNNAVGVLDSKTMNAKYQSLPDKESPLWNMYSKVIYWWTSDQVNEKQAYIVVYNGGVWPRLKTLNLGYLGFRAVKENK